MVFWVTSNQRPGDEPEQPLPPQLQTGLSMSTSRLNSSTCPQSLPKQTRPPPPTASLHYHRNFLHSLAEGRSFIEVKLLRRMGLSNSARKHIMLAHRLQTSATSVFGQIPGAHFVSAFAVFSESLAMGPQHKRETLPPPETDLSKKVKMVRKGAVAGVRSRRRSQYRHLPHTKAGTRPASR